MLKKFFEHFPSCKNIDYIEPSYTFFNNGPHNSIFESTEDIYRKIDEKSKDTDIFIISSGAYSVLLANYIFLNYKKEVFVIGGSLPESFGIHTKRTQLLEKKELQNVKEYIIKVPDEMRPEGYKFIEDGCYW